MTESFRARGIEMLRRPLARLGLGSPRHEVAMAAQSKGTGFREGLGAGPRAGRRLRRETIRERPDPEGGTAPPHDDAVSLRSTARFAFPRKTRPPLGTPARHHAAVEGPAGGLTKT